MIFPTNQTPGTTWIDDWNRTWYYSGTNWTQVNDSALPKTAIPTLGQQLSTDPAFTSSFAQRANNGSDFASAASVRTNIGVICPQPTPRISGRYYRFPNGPLSTSTPTNGDLRLAPAWIWESCTLDRIS